MNRGIRLACQLICGLVFLFVGGVWHSVWGKDPDYPTKPINLLIPFSAGGSTDVCVRALIEGTNKHLKQPLVPVNKPGAAGAICTMAVISSKPDGYTIGQAGPSPGYGAPLSGLAPYKDLKGLTFIMNFADYFYPVMVRADAQWKSWAELIQWAKKNPGDVKIGLPGDKKTAIQPLVFREIEQKEGVKFTYIPFKGAGEVVTALLGGHITLTGTSAEATGVSLLEAGKLRVLIYLNDIKLPGFENVPTSMELYGIMIPRLCGIWGPRGLPDYIVKKLGEAFAQGTKDPEFTKVMKAVQMPIVYMDSNQMSKYVQEEFQKTAELLKRLEAAEALQEKK